MTSVVYDESLLPQLKDKVVIITGEKIIEMSVTFQVEREELVAQPLNSSILMVQ